MSYQGQSWAWKVRGVNRGERAVLDFLAWKQDQRTNVARASVGEIAEHAEISDRQVTNILRQLEAARLGYPHGIIKRIHGGNGRGIVALYSLVGFASPKKGEISSTERVKFSAQRGEISDSTIRNIRTSEELQEEIQNSTPSGALEENSTSDPHLKNWLKLKDQFQRQHPEEDWLRATYFLKLSGDCIIAAHPPSYEIHDRARSCVLFQELFRGEGYSGVFFVKYPDDLSSQSSMWQQFPEALRRKYERKPVRAAI